MFLRGEGCCASYFFYIRSAHRDLVDVSPGNEILF